MHANPHEGSRPTQLVRTDGRWVLEVECLVPIRREILRPVRRKLEGRERIVAQLESTGGPAELVTDAVRIMESPTDPAEELGYEPRDGRWVPIQGRSHDASRAQMLRETQASRERQSHGPRREGVSSSKPGTRDSRAAPDGSQGPSSTPSVTNQLNLELQAKLTQTIELHERTISQVARLEERIVALAEKLQNAPQPTEVAWPAVPKTPALDVHTHAVPSEPPAPVRSRSAKPAAARSAPEAVSPPLAPPPPSRPQPAPQPPAQVAPPQAPPQAPPMAAPPQPARAEVAAPSKEQAPPPSMPMQSLAPAAVSVSIAPKKGSNAPAKGFRLPGIRDANAMARQLIGDKVKLADVTKKGIPLGPATLGFHGCSVIDDQGQEIGIMLSDLKGTVHLGGMLMMLPTRQIQEQLQSGQPIGDVVEALSEIFNTMSALINNIDGNPHVRTTVAEPFVFEAHPWTSSPSRRADYEDVTGGRITILAK